MNRKFWEEYAENADLHYNEEFAKFIKDLALSLHCNTVLEVGCNAGNDLKLFSNEIQVYGVDSNELIIKKAKERLPVVNFKVGEVSKLPFDDASIDMIFTHGFFNYLDDREIEKGIEELFRVSKKYIVNCEIFGDNNIIDENNNRKGRNMFQKWMNYKVKVISNVDMHEEIDPEKSRFTLVKKL